MLKIGIIGCGSIARLRHAREYFENPECEITALYNRRKERADIIAREYGGKVYDSCQALIQSNVDAVSVCTSNDTHASITVEALKAGKHVLCEKPMATTMEGCSRMVDTAEQYGKKLMIGYYQRLTEAHIRAKQILDSGELGELITFTTTYGHTGPEMWSADKGNHTWFFKKDAASFGVMADLGVHKIDLIRWLVGAEVEQVSAFVKTLNKKDETGKPIGVDDNSICLLGFDNGVIGTLSISWTNYGEERNSTVFNCTNGILRVYEHPDYPIEVQFKNGEKVYYKLAGIHSNESEQPNSGVINMFIDAILGDKEPLFSGKDSLKTMEVVFAALESEKTGKLVRI